LELKGREIFEATPAQIWSILMDIPTLARITPGVSRLEETGKNEFNAIADVKIGPVKSSFKGKLFLTDMIESKQFNLNVKQNSKIGNVDAKVALLLNPTSSTHTELSFDGKANFSGTLASKGARVLSGVVSSLSKQFFRELALEIENRDFPEVQHEKQNVTHRKHHNMSHDININLNGKDVSLTVESRDLLADVLRDKLRLTGTHIGCDTSSCGACTILIDGMAVKSCTLLAVQADGSKLVTVEGLAKDGELHPIQKGFKEEHGLQCGFCTPGMMLTAVDLLQRNSNPDEHEIREALEGNFCRCTGYHNIVRAVQHAASNM